MWLRISSFFMRPERWDGAVGSGEQSRLHSTICPTTKCSDGAATVLGAAGISRYRELTGDTLGAKMFRQYCTAAVLLAAMSGA